MFEAVRALNLPKGPSNIGVHDEHGCLIATDTGKAAVVAVYLEHQLTRDEPPLEPFVGPPSPLAKPFTSDEIGAAARSLKNGRSNGPDGIPNKLLKYSTGSVHERFAQTSSTEVSRQILTSTLSDKLTLPPYKSLISPLVQ